MQRGKLITFEGLDGAGKSTQLALFAMKLTEMKMPFIRTKEPGGTPFGQQIRKLVLSKEETFCHETELFLFLADRAHHVEELIKPQLEKGQIVLVDRYVHSTVAYQNSFSVETLEYLNKIATKELFPDLTFYYDFDPNKLYQRMSMRGGEKDRIESKNIDFMHQVRDRFLHLCKTYPDKIILINADQTIEEVAKETYERFREFSEKSH